MMNCAAEFFKTIRVQSSIGITKTKQLKIKHYFLFCLYYIFIDIIEICGRLIRFYNPDFSVLCTIYNFNRFNIFNICDVYVCVFKARLLE